MQCKQTLELSKIPEMTGRTAGYNLVDKVEEIRVLWKSIICAKYVLWFEKQRLTSPHHNTDWLPAGRTVLIKLAGYLCLALLKQRWTFSLRSVIICSINKDIALPFWKGQVQHFLRCWANLQEQKRAEKEVFRGNVGSTTRNGMLAWLCDQVKTGEMAINTVM